MAKRKWTAIPATRSNSVSLKAKQLALFSIFGFMAILGPISLVISLTSNTSTPVTSSVGPGEEVATAKKALLDYFAGIETTVPLAGSVTQNFSVDQNSESKMKFSVRSLDYIETVPNSDRDTNYNIHYFLLVSGENTFKVSLSTSQVDGHSVIVAGPSIEPYYMTNGNQEAIDYTYYSQVQYSADVSKAVQDWAEAFFTNDVEALKAAINDNNEYVGMDGLTMVSTPKIKSYFANSASANTYYARVVIQYSVAGAKQLILTAEYDTLVMDDGTQLPHVVAWGSAGNTPLTPYQNRVN